MSHYPLTWQHTCDRCGKIVTTDSSSCPEGWDFLYQRKYDNQEWCLELCEECLKRPGIYVPYDKLPKPLEIIKAGK